MTSQIWWYLARASGVVAWLMLTASVLWGILLSTRAFPRYRRKAWLLDLHRWLGALTLAFIGLHITSLVADSYTHFGLADVLVPFASAWRPTAVALGVVSGWLLVTVQLTSLAMERLPRRVWHAIHLSSYVTFWVTSLHAVLAGTDRADPLFIVTAAVGVAAVAGATTYRLLDAPDDADHRPRGPRPVPHPAPVMPGPPMWPSTSPVGPVGSTPTVPDGLVTVQAPPERPVSLVAPGPPRSHRVGGRPPPRRGGDA